MAVIYSKNGKPTTATDEDAAAMIEFCGYSAEWPAKAVEIAAQVGNRPDDSHPGTQVDGQGLAPVEESEAQK